jgi:magnesium-dependent phosphatase 1
MRIIRPLLFIGVALKRVFCPPNLNNMVTPADLSILPKLVVFDLDDCLWHPEMYTLTEIPTEAAVGDLGAYGRGNIGAISGGEIIQLYPDALTILQQIYLGSYGDIRIAIASSADTPLAVQIGRTAMNIIEILPGISFRMVLQRGWPIDFQDHLQIGRTPPLSPEKGKTHFPRIQYATQIQYEEMIFFDDCTWSDNCGNVEEHCHGVVTQRTPTGLQLSEWNNCLQKYAKQYAPQIIEKNVLL